MLGQSEHGSDRCERKPEETSVVLDPPEFHLSDFDSTSRASNGKSSRPVGVWTRRGSGRDDKLAAIRIRLSKRVSMHGISLNVAPNPSHYAGIVQCDTR
jgi:lipoyl(octanoyl) transferase